MHFRVHHCYCDAIQCSRFARQGKNRGLFNQTLIVCCGCAYLGGPAATAAWPKSPSSLALVGPTCWPWLPAVRRPSSLSPHLALSSQQAQSNEASCLNSVAQVMRLASVRSSWIVNGVCAHPAKIADPAFCMEPTKWVGSGKGHAHSKVSRF